MSNFEDLLDKIRVKLYEETNGMPKEKIINLVNNEAQEIMAKYGVTLIKASG
ncbi:MAG: hypothetical protein LBQ83_00720 [Candidatus Margulisbacteria bacterium]|jgi:hypothetical protein|nr:hypothetical protein [Candidatus Margulisiibacteriota bacterium]